MRAGGGEGGACCCGWDHECTVRRDGCGVGNVRESHTQGAEPVGLPEAELDPLFFKGCVEAQRGEGGGESSESSC